MGPALRLLVAVAACLPLCGCARSVESAPQANTAQQAVRPFLAGLEPAHTVTICDYGDNGYGPDNQIPWYEAYLTADAATDVAGIVRTAAQTAGYPLGIDQLALNSYPHFSRGPTGISDDDPYWDDILASVPYDPTGTYLVNLSNGAQLSVDIIPTGPVYLDCAPGGSIKKYGQLQPHIPGRTLIVVSMMLPAVGSADQAEATDPQRDISGSTMGLVVVLARGRSTPEA